MKLIYRLLLLLCPYFILAQQPATPLTVGGKLPLSQLPVHFVNKPPTTAAPQLYILNFMATTCGSCIAALPKVNVLQQQFPGQLQLMLITKEAREKVRAFIAKRPWLSLPFAAQHQVLYSYFPHEYISHLVWLSQQGTVLAITGTEYLTEKNISYILAGNTPSWPVKSDIAFTSQKPALREYSALPPILQHDEPQQYSALYTFDSSRLAQVDFVIDSIAGTSRLTSVNQPLLNIITKGLGLSGWQPAFIRLLNVDTALFHFDPARYYKTGWDRQCAFSFETIAPLATTRARHRQMQFSLLQEYFGITARVIDTVICTWSLTQIDTTLPPVVSVVNKNTLSIASLLHYYNKQFAAVPLIDNRLNKQNLFITVPAALPSHPLLLNALLKNYNLVLVPRYSAVAILVISQNRTYPLYSPSKTFLK